MSIIIQNNFFYSIDIYSLILPGQILLRAAKALSINGRSFAYIQWRNGRLIIDGKARVMHNFLLIKKNWTRINANTTYLQTTPLCAQTDVKPSLLIFSCFVQL